MEQISIKLPKSLIERYNEYAKTKSDPRSYFMRQALVEYIGHEIFVSMPYTC